MEEDVEEADEEMDVGEAPPTRDLEPEQVARPGISSRARGKAPTVQVE